MGNKNHLTDANGENLCVHYDTNTKIQKPMVPKEARSLNCYN